MGSFPVNSIRVVRSRAAFFTGPACRPLNRHTSSPKSWFRFIRTSGEYGSDGSEPHSHSSHRLASSAPFCSSPALCGASIAVFSFFIV